MTSPFGLNHLSTEITELSWETVYIFCKKNPTMHEFLSCTSYYANGYVHQKQGQARELAKICEVTTKCAVKWLEQVSRPKSDSEEKLFKFIRASFACPHEFMKLFSRFTNRPLYQMLLNEIEESEIW